MSVQFFRYHDLTPENTNRDLQIHTTWTDGKATINALIEKAAERGLAEMGFTEHVRRDTDWFSEFAFELKTASAQHPEIVKYIGCEAKALDFEGELDISEAIQEQCDLVLGSVHRFPDAQGSLAICDELTMEEFARIEFDLAMGLIRHAPIALLAHPGGMFQRKYERPFPEEYFRLMMAACIERGIAIEINSSYLHDFEGFLTLCEEINPIVSVGSDVHEIQELCNCRDILWKVKGWHL